jgi:glycoprotein endo-alpha-1,2-mannosidase
MGRGRLSTMLLGGLCALILAFPAAAGSGRTAGAGDAAIFYYPWYSTPTRDGQWAHWYIADESGAPVLSTRYFPARGLYSSSNVKLVQAHMREIAAAGIRTVVVSWWGFDSPEDLRLPAVVAAARENRLDVAIHLEPYRERTPASAAEDIAKLHDGGIRDFYVYDADRDPADAWAEALADLDGVRVFAHTHLVGRAKAGGFDGLYTYDVVTWNGDNFARLCSQARRAGLLCAPSVGPGFDARLVTQDAALRPRLHGKTYDRMWRAAVRAKADVVTITSYNEWQEGTQIEPARVQIERASYEGAWGKWGVPAQRAYLDATLQWVLRYRAAFAQ